jgi:hypothetical protein
METVSVNQNNAPFAMEFVQILFEFYRGFKTGESGA